MTILIELRVAEERFPTSDEVRVRHALEDWIAENGVGEVVDAGSGAGVMEIFVEPAIDGKLACERLEAEARQRWPVAAVAVRAVD